jgi:hypothetical protein
LHHLIPFLPLFCNCQFRRLDSVQFLCSQAHILAGSRLETRIFSAELFFITTLHGPRRKRSLCCCEGVFTPPLHSNGRYSIVACASFDAGICLPSRYLAKNVYSDFAIPAFGRHVTVRKERERKVRTKSMKGNKDGRK